MKARLRVTIGAADVGKRVTVRLRTHAAAGEPAFTDVVGELLAWDDWSLKVRNREGSVADVALADLVAGRVVHPPPGSHRR